MKMWFLYLIRCKDGSLYTGITTDVKRRVEQHQGSDGKGSKYLRGRAPLELVLKKRIGDRSLALKIEKRVKKMPRVKKEMFAKGEITVKDIKEKMLFNTESERSG